jgi:hypothetical protein
VIAVSISAVPTTQVFKLLQKKKMLARKGYWEKGTPIHF